MPITAPVESATTDSLFTMNMSTAATTPSTTSVDTTTATSTASPTAATTASTQSTTMSTSLTTSAFSLTSPASGWTSTPQLALEATSIDAILNGTAVDTSLSTTASSATASSAAASIFNTTLSVNETSYSIVTENSAGYLQHLQDRTTFTMIPAMVFLLLLAAVGLVGNSMVLFVYHRRFTITPTRVFIMAIAAFDLVTNVIVIPGEIYDMFNIWNFDNILVCKVRLFFNAFTTMVSAILLVAVAVIRYRKICTPFGWQISVRHSKMLSLAIALASFVFSLPYGIINGRQRKETPRNGVFGYECTIDDSYVDTIWPVLNSGFFILLFIVCCGPLVVLYILIGIKAWKHSKIYGVAGNGSSGHESATNNHATRSTDDASVNVSISPRTRSYIKKKSNPSNDATSPDQQAGVNTPGGLEAGIRKNGTDRVDDNDRPNNDFDDTVEEEEEDNRMKEKKHETSVRMIRATTGEKIEINMIMVKELTVKLKAVQQQIKDKDSEGENVDTGPAEVQDSAKTVTFHEEVSLDNSKVKSKVDFDPESKAGTQRNKASGRRFSLLKYSKSVDDISRLTEEESASDSKGLKPKAAEHEDINLSKPQEVAEDEEEQKSSPPSQEEPMSEFAKAMQWVDITYCLKDKPENENANNETVEEKDNLSKKGSFSVSRKVSRDNSFLQRHRKLRETLTDTLTRSRRSKREKVDVPEAEANAEQANGEAEVKDENVDNDNDTDKIHIIKDGILLKQMSHRRKSVGRRHEDNDAKMSIGKHEVSSDETENRQAGQRSGLRRRGIGRTTAMLILISAVYIVGFMPFLILMFTKVASPGTFKSMSLVAESFYNLFLRSYFLNCAANPIVYSLCDINFRRECFKLLRCKLLKRRII